ncbi:hypothetical protein J2W49_004015 [Hydrogenophaga palleronii]|uniref:Uncharacterized protein n=1 Tax=Hydrogenophaga palleronii TaxID=65655 RepID=A0ABU1WS74_9BURK|nr:hypothetical protein [Hydrogenophaga palleronii]
MNKELQRTFSDFSKAPSADEVISLLAGYFE